MLENLDKIELLEINGGDAIEDAAYKLGRGIGLVIHNTSDFIYGFLGTNLN
jgi:hypothetical protein